MTRVRIKKTLKHREEFTFRDVKNHYSYDPFTGMFKRILSYSSWGDEIKCDKVVKGSNNRGYYWDRIFNTNMLVHRLIWLYMTGCHPTGEIDHIDGDRKNNKWVNLRDVNAFENSRNQGNRSDNTSGCRGVTFNTNSKKWVARISHHGVRHSLGYYTDKQDAIEARKKAEQKLKYHINHGKREAWRNEN